MTDEPAAARDLHLPPGGRLYATTSSPSLEGLLDRVACGDRAAFERLYAVVAGPVYGLVALIVRSPGQNEQVAQEVMVELWRTASRYQPARADAMTWVMMLARHRALDHVRATRAGRIVERDDGPMRNGTVRRCLDPLADDRREVLALAYYGGYTSGQIADFLGIPDDTVRTWIGDALLELGEPSERASAVSYSS